MSSRLEFAYKAVEALRELHATKLRDVQFVHRHISPNSLLVGANDQPIFTEFDLARISGSTTLAPSAVPPSAFAAPEVVTGGLGVADRRWDVFSLSKTLAELFATSDDKEAVNEWEENRFVALLKWMRTRTCSNRKSRTPCRLVWRKKRAWYNRGR